MQLEGRCAEPAGSHAAGGRRAQRFTGAPAVMACDEDRRWILNICGSVSRPGGDVADHHAARPAVRHRPRAGGVSESVGRERSETLIVDTGCERARPPTSASLPKSQKCRLLDSRTCRELLRRRAQDHVQRSTNWPHVQDPAAIIVTGRVQGPLEQTIRPRPGLPGDQARSSGSRRGARHEREPTLSQITNCGEQ